MIVYKVVYRVGKNGPYESVGVPSSRKHCVNYKEGQWSEALTGPLFAFETLEQAQDISRHDRFCRIFRAEAVSSNVPVPQSLAAPYLETHDIHDWWQRLSQERCGRVRVPEGTVLCQKIKPLEMVK